MLFGIPLTVWFGILGFIFILLTLGIAMAISYLKKPYLNYHKLLAIIAFIVILIHVVLAVLWFFFGIII
jgi:DMSO/TMAO reductase YedYZ heme-binding membrane subunit